MNMNMLKNIHYGLGGTLVLEPLACQDAAPESQATIPQLVIHPPKLSAKGLYQRQPHLFAAYEWLGGSAMAMTFLISCADGQL